eukprot:Skav231968  [mRNA]  locus=scaffold2806:313290:315188:+ [translate_table: standard]
MQPQSWVPSRALPFPSVPKSTSAIGFQSSVGRGKEFSSLSFFCISFCFLKALAPTRRRQNQVGLRAVSTTALVDPASIAASFSEACRNGKQQAVLKLLRNHPQEIRTLVSKPLGKDRITPLSYLCWFVLCDAIEALCSECGDEIDPQAVDHALSLVCRFGKTGKTGKPEALKILIRHFPEVCRQGMARDLAEACRKSRLEATGSRGGQSVVKLLMALLPVDDAADPETETSPDVSTVETDAAAMVSADGRQLLQQQRGC